MGIINDLGKFCCKLGMHSPDRVGDKTTCVHCGKECSMWDPFYEED